MGGWLQFEQSVRECISLRFSLESKPFGAENPIPERRARRKPSGSFELVKKHPLRCFRSLSTTSFTAGRNELHPFVFALPVSSHTDHFLESLRLFQLRVVAFQSASCSRVELAASPTSSCTCRAVVSKVKTCLASRTNVMGTAAM